MAMIIFQHIYFCDKIIKTVAFKANRDIKYDPVSIFKMHTRCPWLMNKLYV